MTQIIRIDLIYWSVQADEVSDTFLYTLFLIIFLTEELKEMKYKIDS